MRGQDIQGDDALTAEEQALIDASAAAPPSAAADDMPSAGVVTEASDAAAPEPAEQAQQQPKMVPHEALHQERRLAQEERRRAQEAEARLAEVTKRSQTLEERMNLLLQRGFAQPEPAPAPPVEPEIPDINHDPVGHILGQVGRQVGQLRNDLGQRDQIIAALAQAVSGQGRQSEAAQAANAVAREATRLERVFASQTPDYQQAYEHLLQNRAAELKANGWTDEGEIQMKLASEAHDLAQSSIQRGTNPAAVAYELAKIRGYQPPQQSSPANGANDASAAAAQIATIAAGQQQARGINRVPGQASAAPSAATIANMSDEEFSKWAAKATEKERRAVGL